MTPARFVFERYPVILRAAGVRFIITDAPMPDALDGRRPSATKLRAELTIPTPPSAQAAGLLSSSQPALESFQLYLYELENPNLGQFSPIEVKQLEDALAVREALVNPIWELDHTVFGIVPGTGPFQKASLTVTRFVPRARARPSSCYRSSSAAVSQ